jgi:hypothetical protein
MGQNVVTTLAACVAEELAADGTPAATSFQVAGSALPKQLYGAPLRDGIDGFTVRPYMHQPYRVPERRVDYGFVHSDVPIGWWRPYRPVMRRL